MYNLGFVSLGCDKNRVDSEIMLYELKKNGFNIVNNREEADIIVINTCGFIEPAVSEAIKTILEMAQLKEKRLKGLIVAGCLPKRYGSELLKEMPEIDGIIGPNDILGIAELANKIVNNGTRGIVKINNKNYNFDYEDRILTTPEHYAYIKIAEGCSNMCSYCTIPSIRGPLKSRPMEDILREIESLRDRGVKEFILVAQDSTMYGIDIYKKRMITELLKKIENIDGIKWVRILYSYPEEITNELIDVIKDSKIICHYFDIPLQHINDNLLKSMRRRHTKDMTIKLIKKIRDEIPDAVIRTSLIVGLPGEGEEEFCELKEFLKEYPLDRVGVFPYSREEGTTAYSMPNQVDEDVKLDRQKEIMELQQRISLDNNKKLIGKSLEVVIEEIDDKGRYIGRSSYDAPLVDQLIYIKSEKSLNIGEFVKVRINKAYAYDLMGDVIYESCK